MHHIIFTSHKAIEDSHREIDYMHRLNEGNLRCSSQITNFNSELLGCFDKKHPMFSRFPSYPGILLQSTEPKVHVYVSEKDELDEQQLRDFCKNKIIEILEENVEMKAGTIVSCCDDKEENVSWLGALLQDIDSCETSGKRFLSAGTCHDLAGCQFPHMIVLFNASKMFQPVSYMSDFLDMLTSRATTLLHLIFMFSTKLLVKKREDHHFQEFVAVSRFLFHKAGVEFPQLLT